MGNVRLLINCDRHAMGLADTEAEQVHHEATAASGANCCPKDRHEHAHRLGGVTSNDNMTTWSDWSPTGSGTTLLSIFNNVQVSGFPHHFQGLPTPTGMTLRWYSPTGLTGSNLLSVDNTGA